MYLTLLFSCLLLPDTNTCAEYIRRKTSLSEKLHEVSEEMKLIHVARENRRITKNKYLVSILAVTQLKSNIMDEIDLVENKIEEKECL